MIHIFGLVAPCRGLKHGRGYTLGLDSQGDFVLFDEIFEA